MYVLLSGSHGLIGNALASALHAGGHKVRKLVRSHPSDDEVLWDPMAGKLDSSAFDGIDAVVHLAGAGIGDKRWNDEYKRQILASRAESTLLLSQAMSQLANPPDVFVSGSAGGAYGDQASETLNEDSELGDDFLAEVCKQWEGATAEAVAAGIRVINIRSGIVLSPHGGALARMLTPFKLGLGGRIGSGDQWWSWISIDDEIGAILHCLETAQLSGPVNLTAPAPVTNADFTKALGRALHRPTPVPTPSFALIALLGKELANTLLFTSARILPAKLQDSGYVFEHATVDEALHDLLDR